MKSIIYFAVVFFVLFTLISCNTTSVESNLGTISVKVVDSDSTTPIPNIDITITPENLVKKTDEKGVCTFSVKPGDYYVDADVCCAGPGPIHYHEPAAIVQDKTVEIKLVGCSMCQ